MDKKEIKKYDKRGNLIYYKCLDGLESWSKYNENNNEIHFKRSDGFECWKEYYNKGNLIHYKSNELNNEEIWFKINKNGDRNRITEQEFKQKEYLSRKKVSRFELMEI